MTAAKASAIRLERIAGKELSNQKRREEAKKQREPEWTFARLWNAYIEHKGQNYSSYKTDLTNFNRHLAEFHQREPKSLVQWELQKMVKEFKNPQKGGKGLADATIHHVLSLLGRVASFGFDFGYSEPIPFKIKKPAVFNEVEDHLTVPEIYHFLHTLDQCEASNIVAHLAKVLIYTGHRPIELYKLRWEDVDMEAQSMMLLKTKSGRDFKLHFSDKVKEILLEMPRLSEEWVFPNLDGSQRFSANKAANTIKVAAKLPASYRPIYCLRHTFAILAVNNGIPYHHIQKINGT